MMLRRRRERREAQREARRREIEAARAAYLALPPLDALLDELEADLRAWGYVALYEFSWFLRGFDSELTQDAIAAVCHQAYTELARRHTLHLEWLDGPPLDLAAGRCADPGTPLDFDIDTRGEVDSPFLVLVPD